MQVDTRQDPSNRPSLAPAEDEFAEPNIIIQDSVDQLQDLYMQRNALENYREMLVTAGPDGLDHVAKQIMMVNLQQLKLKRTSVGMESFDPEAETITVEDFSEWISNLGTRIKELIEKLIAMAKEVASRIMSGVDQVKNKAEELIDRASKRKAKQPSNEQASNEFHDSTSEITINDPTLLWANGEFCIDDCKAEQEVIKFFTNIWPRYAKEQINRAKKMIAEYDVESGNSDNFESNIGFLGNHKSMVANISELVLPGNKQIAFKHGALGPELVDAENAEPAPNGHRFEVRHSAKIKTVLQMNIATMNAMNQMFKAEYEILNEMATLSQALMGLEDRRGETVWKSARDGLDDISKAMMDLITRLKPNYDPIVRHLAKVGAARNALCQKELDALGQ